MAELTGAQILIECWKKEGVELVFGYPGATTIDIHHYLMESGLRFVLTRHEQAAVHAAEGYARVTGRPGVALVTSGPGATNAVTGLAAAYLDSIPVIVFSGQVARMMIGNDAFQEVDIVGITRPITKHNYLVRDTESLARTVKEAFYVAASGRPGSILVDLPKDVLAGTAEFRYPGKVRLRAYQPHLEPHPKQVAKAVELMLAAKKPVIYAGGGVAMSRAGKALLTLAERLQIPVTNTLMGLGGFPGTHPLFLGMLGMHGLYQANRAVQECDLLIAVGARFDDRVTGRLDRFAQKAKIIQIDVDPTSIHKRVTTQVPMVADAQQALQAILELLGRSPDYDREARGAWLAAIARWKNEGLLDYRRLGRAASCTGPGCVNHGRGGSFEPIQPQMVVETLYEKAKDRDPYICTEVGQHQMWAAQYYLYDKPRRFLTSGGLGVMGFGLPAAIGAQVARPEALVIDVAGDGSILMNIQELVTIVEEKLPIKVVILNNGCLGMVRQWQQLFYGGRYSGTLLGAGPDFVRLAEAFGARGFRATRPEEVAGVMEKGLAAEGPVVMDFIVCQQALVYPMVAAGKEIGDMLPYAAEILAQD
ncbi:MAG: biosynthetic-type acetolactate synthase large subunit [Candidatus Adiutrix sp.]|jgi:acetolactate synthase-1/2/3 large subunit|nr:biosynthetic-type acetolactate synthase large subunit [Candidatus Adiutrix sp.]